jgi:hypothetical protein
MPTFSWPSLPTWTWPDIPAPAWLANLGDYFTGKNGTVPTQGSDPVNNSAPVPATNSNGQQNQPVPVAAPEAPVSPSNFVSPNVLQNLYSMTDALAQVGTAAVSSNAQLAGMANGGIAAVTTQATGATASTGLTRDALDVLGQVHVTPIISQQGAEDVTASAGVTQGALESIPTSWSTALRQAGAEAVTGAANVTQGALENIPTSWFSSIQQAGAEGVAGAAYGAANAINSVPTERYSTVSASVSGTGAVLDLVNAINSMHDVTTYVTTITNSGLNAVAKATGGYVRSSLAELAEQGPELVRSPAGTMSLVSKRGYYPVTPGSYVYPAAPTAAIISGAQHLATGGYVRAEDGSYVPTSYYDPWTIIKASVLGSLKRIRDKDGKLPDSVTSEITDLTKIVNGSHANTRGLITSLTGIQDSIAKLKVDDKTPAEATTAASLLGDSISRLTRGTASTKLPGGFSQSYGLADRTYGSMKPVPVKNQNRRTNTPNYGTGTGNTQNYTVINTIESDRLQQIISDSQKGATAHNQQRLSVQARSTRTVR